MVGEKTKKIATFMISFDTELAWGRIATPNDGVLKILRNDPQNVRGAIKKLLQILNENDIKATWAIVGHLFLDHCESEEGIPHKSLSRPTKNWYSFDPCSDINKSPLYYGRDIIESLLSNPVKHDIGLHSFSHVLFSDCTREVANDEVKESIRLAKKFGIDVKSFVFPQNKIGHIDVLKENGIQIYRGNNSLRAHPQQTFLIRKLHGFADVIKPQLSEAIKKDGVWEISSSGIFGEIPQIPNGLIFRSRLAMQRAIDENGIFHIWLHPESLLIEPNLAEHLARFLKIVSKLRDEGKVKVMTMADLADYLDKNGTC